MTPLITEYEILRVHWFKHRRRTRIDRFHKLLFFGFWDLGQLYVTGNTLHILPGLWFDRQGVGDIPWSSLPLSCKGTNTLCDGFWFFKLRSHCV